MRGGFQWYGLVEAARTEGSRAAAAAVVMGHMCLLRSLGNYVVCGVLKQSSRQKSSINLYATRFASSAQHAQVVRTYRIQPAAPLASISWHSRL